MSHPAARVLAVLELLQTHGRMSGTELARRLEVDPRTLRRYINTLEDIGIPITAERGRHGAYMLVKGFKLPPLIFTNDEILAISLGLLSARGLGLAQVSAAIESAQAKLERVMPANLKRRVRAVSETTTLDLAAPPVDDSTASDGAALAALTAAAQSRVRVRIGYRSAAGGISERDLDPYGLVFRGGRWYVAGFCHLRQGVRSFRLDRIGRIDTTDVGFEPPENFDAARHLTFSIASLPRSVAVEIVFEADTTTVLTELDESLGLFEARDGQTLMRARTDSINWLARQLAGLSFGFRIVEPAALRVALRRHAEGLLDDLAG